MTLPSTVTALGIHLDDDALECFGRELDAIQDEIKASLGDRDRRYIKRVIAIQRSLALAGRLTIYASLPLLPTGLPFFAVIGAGTVALALSKILENMEIGHNIIHGQWDWMNDPAIRSATWEWDNVCPADQWKHSHNVVHHTWTNVLGKDRDVGYDILRISEKQPWRPAYLFQPFYAALLALLFEWGVAMHDIDLGALRSGRSKLADVRALLQGIARKAAKQMLKDYVFWPLLAGPFFLYVLGANAAANVLRNLWTYMIIFCGHFPDGSQVFSEADIVGETRGGWYLRQILGSCNIEGNALFHVMSGNLSHQIEHHLFPDMPSNRYPEAAPRVRALCERYGIPYNSGSLGRQFGTTVRTILRLALPGTKTLESVSA
ncbi:MAG: fatty acid desaturase family protein [Polyangiaceae bacterium]|jgi:NADPH-dependent stearoyl-CoA 9-desaturase